MALYHALNVCRKLRAWNIIKYRANMSGLDQITNLFHANSAAVINS